jgi:hypothetical protein
MPKHKTAKVPKPKMPHTPHWVEKHPNWEVMSLPRSWRSASTTAANNPNWLEDRAEIWDTMRRNYKREMKNYTRKLARYKEAEFQALRNSVVAQAATVARFKSAEYQAEQAAKAAARAVAASAKKVAAAERESLKAIAEASKPPTARNLRMAARRV